MFIYEEWLADWQKSLAYAFERIAQGFENELWFNTNVWNPNV